MYYKQLHNVLFYLISNTLGYFIDNLIKVVYNKCKKTIRKEGDLMAQATFSIRMDEKLKREFDNLCSDFGMNATTAFNVFARAVVREKKIPFEIQASSAFTNREQGRNAFMALRWEAKQNGIQDMSLDEINSEIRKSRYGEDDV